MVTAARRVDLRCPAELAREPNDRGVEQAALIEIGDQAGDPGVERGHLIEAVLGEIDVRIPGAVVERDEPRASLDQPAGEHQVLREAFGVEAGVGPDEAGHFAAVQIQRRFGFAFERERVLRRLRGEERSGPLVEIIHRVLNREIGREAAEAILHDVAGLHPAFEALRGQTACREVAHFEVGLRSVGVDLERAVGAA